MTRTLIAVLLLLAAPAARAASVVATGRQPVIGVTGDNQVTATGSTTARRLRDRFADVVNVKDFGAKGDGVSDDTAAIIASFAAASAVSGTVYGPRGIYVVQTLDLPLNVSFRGDGRLATVLKAKAGLAAPVLRTTGFGALTGSGSTGGMTRNRLADFSIDGNSTGTVGLQLYGWAFNVERVTVSGCTGDGVYTEWGTDRGGTGPDTAMEAHFIDVRSMNNGGNGMTYNGPHDAVMIGLVAKQNGGWGFASGGAGTTPHIVNMNVWNNTLGGCDFELPVNGWNIAAGSSGAVPDILLGANSHASLLSDVQLVGATATGIEIRSYYNRVSGNAYGCAVGVKLNGAYNCDVQMSIAGGTVQGIDFTGSGGGHRLSGTAVIPGGGSLFVGAPAGNDSVSYSVVGGDTSKFQMYGATAGAGIKLLSGISAGDSGADFVFSSTTARSAGVLVQFQNNGTPLVNIGTNGRLLPATPAGAQQFAAGLWAGTGAPNNANGTDGDLYFRSDGGALTTIYQRRAGAWVGIL